MVDNLGRVHRRRLAGVTMLLGVFIFLSSGCGAPGQSQSVQVTPDQATAPATAPVRELTEVAVVQTEAKVKRENSQVQAGPANVSPLPLLSDNEFHALAAQSVVATNDDGEAQVEIRDCLTVFVFQRSQLVTASCPRSSAVSGSPTCAFGTSAFSNNCAGQVVIQTRSAQIELQGTWLTVTYLPERQLSLAMIYEGQAKIWPVRDFESRTLGEPLTVGERHFWFSNPGDTAASVAGLRGRRVYPFEMAPDVMAELNMNSWLSRIKPRAEADGIDFPEYLIMEPTPTPAVVATATYRPPATETPRPPVTTTRQPTATVTRVPPPTATATVSATATVTPTATVTRTPTVTPTRTPTQYVVR